MHVCRQSRDKRFSSFDPPCAIRSRVSVACQALPRRKGRGSGRRGPQPKPWRYRTLHYRVETFTQRQKRTRRGRPPKAESPRSMASPLLLPQPTCITLKCGATGWFLNTLFSIK